MCSISLVLYVLYIFCEFMCSLFPFPLSLVLHRVYITWSLSSECSYSINYFQHHPTNTPILNSSECFLESLELLLDLSAPLVAADAFSHLKSRALEATAHAHPLVRRTTRATRKTRRIWKATGRVCVCVLCVTCVHWGGCVGDRNNMQLVN